jgi:hypothetical protein
MVLYFDMQPLPEHVLDLEPGLTLWFRFNEHGDVVGWITRPDVFPFDEEDESVSDLWVKHRWAGDDWEPRYNRNGDAIVFGALDPRQVAQAAPTRRAGMDVPPDIDRGPAGQLDRP